MLELKFQFNKKVDFTKLVCDSTKRDELNSALAIKTSKQNIASAKSCSTDADCSVCAAMPDDLFEIPYHRWPKTPQTDFKCDRCANHNDDQMAGAHCYKEAVPEGGPKNGTLDPHNLPIDGRNDGKNLPG